MTTGLPQIVWVDSPAALPHKLPKGRFAVVDVAFASGERFLDTERFIREHHDDLAAWVDHHKHDGWARFSTDARFVLVPNVQAHACPELVTREVVQRAGPVERVLAHADFDGLMSAVNWLRGGEPPYPEANEDARAADSPGRGHHFTERGRRIADALEEHREKAHTPQRHALMTEVALALVQGSENAELQRRLDELCAKAAKTVKKAHQLFEKGRAELPGLFVVRHPANLSPRLKKNVLMLAEERAPIAVVVESVEGGVHHVTAATFREDLDLSRVAALPVGRSDFRFVNKIEFVEPILEALSALAAPNG